MKLSCFRKFYLATSVLLCSLFVTSCSAFFGADSLTITSTSVDTDAEGNTVITVNFAEEGKEPLTFTIPKAIDGEDGVGIANVSSVLSDDKTLVTITITYTDVNKAPSVITVPVYRGEDGKEITNIISDFDAEGNTTIVFEYSDGTKSDTLTINKGNDGKGIKNITINTLENGNYELIINYTDGTSEKPMYVNSGVGITSVVYDEEKSDETRYCLIVNYTDGTSSELYLPKQKTTKWISGNAIPSDDIGNDGDFYVIESSGAVYTKTGNSWRYLFSIKGIGSDLTYTVSFNLNGGRWTNGNLTNPEESATEIRTINRLTYGSFIDLDQSYLECYNENFEFKGWWSDAVITPNSGHFTNLTPVTSDITLFAIWG